MPDTDIEIIIPQTKGEIKGESIWKHHPIRRKSKASRRTMSIID